MRWFCAVLLTAFIGSAASAAPETVAGRVLDAQGAPVAGAEATAYFKFYVPQPHRMRLERADSAIVGADGGFAFELNLPRGCGEVVVLARKADLAPSWVTFYFNPARANESKDITLEECASISGTVSDEAGNPISGAEVTADLYLPPENGRLERRIGGGPPLDWLRTKTDAQGCFTIKDLPKSSSADLHVTASEKGGRFLEKPRKPVGAFDAGAADIRVTLEPEAHIQGTVVDEDTQAPLAGVPVLVVGNSKTLETDAQVVLTGPDGAFEAAGLPAADYTISVARSPFQMPAALAKPVAVKDLKTGEVRKEIVLPASPGGLVEIRLTNEKKEPVSDARVVVQARSINESQRSGSAETAISGEDGIAAFRFPPETYRVAQIDHEFYFLAAPDDVLDVEKGKTVRLELPLPEKPHASGVVLDAQGKPVAGAKVTVIPSFPADKGAVTDEDGKFKLHWRPWNGNNGGGTPLLARKPEADLVGTLTLEDQERTDGLQITLAPGIRITGAVVDPDNGPIAQANIRVSLQQAFGASWLPESISTGPDGRYTVRAVPDDRDCRVLALAKSFGQNQSTVDMTAAKDRTVEMAPITLKRANLSVTGIVVDEDDKPVSGANVNVGGDEQNVPSSVLSDKDGKFTLKNLCDADATIRAWKRDGGEVQQGSVNYTSDMKEVKLVLGENAGQQGQGAASLHASGVVVDAQGQPVAGATVQVLPNGRETRKTDQDGKFKISWQPWPNQNIQNFLLVRTPKAGLAAAFALEDPDKLADLKITLAPGITVAGTVVDPDNQPIPKAEIQLTVQQSGYNTWLQERIRTDQDGKYSIGALPGDGNYEITATASNFGQIRVPVDLSTAKDRVVTLPPLALKRGNLTVTGIVVDEDNKPVSGANINVFGEEQNVPGNVQSDKDGKFKLKNLCDADATIRAWNQGGDEQQQGSVYYTSDMKEVKIILGENAGQQGQGVVNLHASGVVVDAQGQPVAGATVQAMPSDRETRKTDKDGKFKVSWQLWPNQNIQNSLLVRTPKADLAAVFALEDMGKLDDLKISLAPGVTITGTVVDPDNHPIPKAGIQLLVQQNGYNMWLEEQIRTGTDGKYTIHALPADANYQLIASAGGFGRKPSPADMTAVKDRTVEMPPIILKRANLTVTGIVVDEDDKPVSGANINAYGEEQNGQGQNALSDKNGKFTLKNLCDADATIRAWKQVGAGQNAQGTVNFTPDMKEVKITLGENDQWGRPAAPRPPPVSAQQLFTEGQKAMDAQKWAEAVARFKELVEKYPTHALTPDALSLAIGICENRLNDQKTADELRAKEAALSH